ncbi:MAG: nuclear transport factor 2 family protein [Chloroflexi bacterium]|nr:nuclear transport factor 2 family protein [Chloroflexota bacterium]MCC6895337.1 nuclear transport factor 2 family protein [Anaerolineae bacterium]
MATPTEVVQKQLDAYNAHDIDAFLATYALDAKLRDFPSGDFLIVGHTQLRERYSRIFANKAHVDVAERIANGDYVVNHEFVKTANEEFYAVAIYHVTNGRIDQVWFLTD